MNVSTASNAAHQQQQQTDSNDLYNNNNLQNYNLVSSLPQQQQQHIDQYENENDNNNNFQHINELKQQQTQHIMQLNSNLAQQSSQFQITSIQEQGQEQIEYTNNVQYQAPVQQQQLQQQQQQPVKDNKESRFRIVKTDSELKTESKTVNSGALNGSAQADQENNDPNRTLNCVSYNNSYNRGRWLVMDSDASSKQTVSIQPVKIITNITNSNCNSPLINTNSALLADSDPSYNTNKDKFMNQQYGSVNSNENEIHPVQTTTLPQTHFNPINSNTDSTSYYSTQQQVFSTNQPIAQSLASPSNNKNVTSSTNITIKPVPLIQNLNSNNIPNNLPQVVLINNSTTATVSATESIIQNSVNNPIGHTTSTTSSTNSSGPSSTNSTSSNQQQQQQQHQTPSSMMSNLKEKLQTNLETIQMTQSSIGQVGLVTSSLKPSNQLFSNQLQQKDEKTNEIYSQNTEQQTSTSNHYQQQQQQQQPAYDTLNVTVSSNTNSSSSNSDFTQSSPKEQVQHTASTNLQMINNTLSNQSSSSINGNNTPPLSNLASSSSTAIFEQTTATLNQLISDTDSGVSDLDKKSLFVAY